MKKILLLLVVGLLLSSFSIAGGENFNFVGKWMGKDETGSMGGFVFDKDGYVTLIKDGKEMGGKNSVIEGKTVIMKYVINQNTNPINFDLEMIGNGRKKKAFFIIKVVNKDKIVIAGDMNETRPKAFTKDNSIALTRQ